MLGNVEPKISFRGLHGRESSSFGLPIPTLRREVAYVEPAVTLRLGERRGLELAVPLSVRGRNWPVGPLLNVSFWQTF